MAVQFILGRSGTGKTACCVRAIVDALREPSEQPLLFLVPEQATYQAERAILSDERICGYHRLHILSFDRLQFLLLGRNTVRPTISRIGRQMVVHKILRDNLDMLQVFGSSALRPGFAREMAATITELHRYARSPEDIEGLLECLQAGGGRWQAGERTLQPPASSLQPGPNGYRLSALKFADIALVFRRYAEALRDQFIDPDAQVTSACRAVAKAEFIKGARLWVDGFASFTGGEMALLIELLKAVDQACVALCVDPADPGIGVTDSGSATRVRLFEPTVRTYREMLERLAEGRVKMLGPVTLRQVHRFADSPALAHMERNIFRMEAGRLKAAGDIRFVATPSLRQEIQFVAREILGLVREKGFRYRDIAVVASDLDGYEQYVRAYFDDYGIPFFIDKRKGLNQHPVVELVCAALQAATGSLAHADIFAWLKTDLVPVDRSAVDTLENYCLAFGVDGRDWASPEPWRFQDPESEEFDEDELNRIRGEAIGPLLELREALCPDGDIEKRLTAGEFTRVIFSFLDRLAVRQTVSGWIDEAHEGRDVTAADEHRQFFDTFVDIFDALVEIFERQEMTAQDYLGLLTSAFSQMTLAFIPPKLDQVLVGMIERSRHPNLKALFLLGATQKQFPAPLASSGVLTDEDRDAAEAAGFQIAPSSMQSLVDRQYLAYIAFTRPSKFLCISYPCVDEKGSPILRSHFVDELQSLFEDVSEEFVSDSLLGLSEVQNASELGELLCSRLGRDALSPEAGAPGELAELLEAMQSGAEYRPMAEQIVCALRYDNRTSLEPGVVRELFGRYLRGSATRLGTFAACPYRHFARYTLDLQPRREFKLEPLDLGRFYHEVLDAFHERLAQDVKDAGTVEDERLVALLREQIAALAAANPFVRNFIRRSAHNAFIISNAGDVLQDCVLEVGRMIRAGSFRPVGAEVGFGDVHNARENLGPFELTLPDGRVFAVDGKIDRLDVAEIDGRRMALVFDYKSTTAAARFDWSELYHGLDMQLALYLLAVRATTRQSVDDVAGAFCMPIQVRPDRAAPGESGTAADRFDRKARGFFNGEYFQHLDPEAGPRWSRLYNFAVTAKDGQYGYYPTSAALTPEHFERVLRFTTAMILALVERMVSGEIDVCPYRLGTRAACTICDYKAVCRFDWQINDYRLLPSAGKLDVVQGRRDP